MKYALNYVHLFVYSMVCSGSYYGILTGTYIALNIGMSFLLGWSLYGLVTIGHDCVHGNFSPYATVNHVLSIVCLNMILMPWHQWKEEHSSHHQDPGHDDDHMLLIGATWSGRWKHILCSQQPIPWKYQLCKVPLLVALCFLPWYGLPFIWWTFIACFIYLSLTPHLTTPHLKEWDKDEKQAADIAWNIFPSSHVYTLLAGGLNIHGCHHHNCKWTRSELMHEADETYMTIATLSEFMTLMQQ